MKLKICVLVLMGCLLAMDASPLVQAGPDDFRISRMGPDGDDGFVADNADVAYNALDHEFLVTWSGTDNTSPLVQHESEIFAIRIDADTGAPLMANPVRVSFMGPNGAIEYGAFEPSVAWNGDRNEYVIAWWGDLGTGEIINTEAGPIDETEREVFAQRVSAAGSLLGDVVRVSFMGEDGDVLAEGIDPDALYNPNQQEYYVVWYGDHIDGLTQVNQDFEVFGQRLGADDLTPIGNNQRLSDMGETDADARFNAADAQVTLNPSANEYLVVWEGDDDAGDTVDGEQEIYGQLVAADTGLGVGENDFRISFKGPEGAIDFDSTNAAAAYHPVTGEYLVVWNGSDEEDGTVRNDIEIYAQRLTSNGVPIGPMQQRISAMGEDGFTTWWALVPRVAVNPMTNNYVVVWQGEDDEGDLVNNEFEIYAQELDASGGLDGPRLRLSRTGLDGDPVSRAAVPSLAYASDSHAFLVVFSGIGAQPELAPREREIFGQFLKPDGVFESGFE